MASTKQEQQGSQALLNTVQACFGQHLDEQVVRTVFEADQSKDFLLVSDVLWELLPEVSHPAQLKPVADWDVCVKERLVSLVGAVEFLLDPRQHCTTTTAARRQLRDVPTSCNAVVVSTQAQCASCRFDAFTTARYSLSKHNCRRLPVVFDVLTSKLLAIRCSDVDVVGISTHTDATHLSPQLSLAVYESDT